MAPGVQEAALAIDPLELVRLGRTPVTVTRLGFDAAPIGGLYEAVAEADAVVTVRHAWDMASAPSTWRPCMATATPSGAWGRPCETGPATRARCRPRSSGSSSPEPGSRPAWWSTARPPATRRTPTTRASARSARCSTARATPSAARSRRAWSAWAWGASTNSGRLADPRPGATFDYAPAAEAWVEKARRVRDVCARHGVSQRAAAVQFVFAHPAVVTLVAGVRRVAHLDEYPTLMRAPIPAALWEELRSESLLPRDAPVPAP